jgi:HPt (histidine-containing phosphotransfer) domain-containing protein
MEKSALWRADESGMSTNHTTTTSNQALTPLVSEFASDPDMKELVDFFITELTDRIDAMHEALEADDRDRLKTLAHQLKGAAGGYGFSSITTEAAEVERAVLTQQAELSTIAEKVESLIALCKRATMGAARI